MNAVKQRRYQMLTDYGRVYDFLAQTYDSSTLNGYLLPAYFEYGHTHRNFNYHLTHHIGLWEAGGAIVGIACYGMYPGQYPGQCHLHVRSGFDHILPQMLDWGELELSTVVDDKRHLGVWIVGSEADKRDLLRQRGYAPIDASDVTIFDYAQGFAESRLPTGFELIDGTNVDYAKLHSCFHRGFEGTDDPENNVDGRLHQCLSPHFRHDLMTIATAPNGEYACTLGMWLDEVNKYAYLEPLATAPAYRRLGLAAAALTEAMKKTQKLGAKYCIGSSGAFYYAMGFKVVCKRELWKREWDK